MMKESILRDIKKGSPSGRFATTQSSVRSNEMLDVSSHINKLKDGNKAQCDNKENPILWFQISGLLIWGKTATALCRY